MQNSPPTGQTSNLPVPSFWTGLSTPMEFFAEHRRKMENALGLAMTGGGARGAYQAGVLKRIGAVQRRQTNGNPFPIIGCSSAGAINGSALASGADDFALTTKALAHLWASLQPADVFRSDVLSQARNSITWIFDLSFGAVLGGGNARSFLDASPLQRYRSEERRVGKEC